MPHFKAESYQFTEPQLSFPAETLSLHEGPPSLREALNPKTGAELRALVSPCLSQVEEYLKITYRRVNSWKSLSEAVGQCAQFREPFKLDHKERLITLVRSLRSKF